MAFVVKKFGGSSVATPEKIYHLVDRVLAEKKPDDKIVIVVSAMGDTTDERTLQARDGHAAGHGRAGFHRSAGYCIYGTGAESDFLYRISGGHPYECKLYKSKHSGSKCGPCQKSIG